MHIDSNWLDFIFGVRNGVCRNGILLLAGKGSGTLHFQMNFEYKMVFVAMVCFCLLVLVYWLILA